ncbi:MAG TPA: CopG family transcriptional regulator [bacterium]|nr:CopG family transcriptional regulator [bacterium]
MERTQIYLTKEEREALKLLSERTGQSQSALIRQAIDRYAGQYSEEKRSQYLQKARGIWKNRTDVPDIRRLRSEIDCEILYSR